MRPIRNFNSYRSDRKAITQGKRDAARSFAVKRLNRDGSLSKLPAIARCATRELAQDQVSYLESINPGRLFIVEAE